jgi:hypothetical protein
MAGMACHGAALWGSLGFGKAGVVWRGTGRIGGVWWVEARQVGRGGVWCRGVSSDGVRQVWLA